MSRYIDADELLKKAIYPFIELDMKVVTVEDIKSAPTADVKPIIRGKWICASGSCAVCNKCNRLNEMYDNFCKHCGADMREEREEEE